MGDYLKKPKKYRHERCLTYERLRREEREAGNTVVEMPPCEADFPCFANIMVLSGLEKPCPNCAPNLKVMREVDGWERHPATHGEFYTSLSIHHTQLQRILDLIGQRAGASA